MRRDRVNLLVITTDYLFVIRPQNFIEGKQGAILDQNLIMIERLKDIYEYRVMMSPELHIEPRAGKQTEEPRIVPAGFFLVVVSAVDQNTGANRPQKQKKSNISVQEPSQEEVQVDMFSPQDHQVDEPTDQIVESKFHTASAREGVGANARLGASHVLSYRKNRAVNVIENQSLTSIATKLHRDLKVKEFYNEIADFSYLKVGKVNG